jgi:hypothetical protein
VLRMFPSIGSVGRRFASLHRVLRGEFPCFLGNIKALRLPAAHPAARVTPPRRKTRFQPLVRRYWTGFSPAGFLRKVSECFLTSHPPFPSFAWRNLIDRRAQIERF